ncbi:MAG: 30S ribosomal protein S4 [Thermodesulfobacteriota bacterium]
MSRYTGAVCKLCRREGEKLFLKGERCLTSKCAIERKPYPPGMQGKRIRRRVTEYGLRLREKQKARRIYGVTERQFKIYFREAVRTRGVTGSLLLSIIETRLDNVVFRLGFASSRNEARQLVNLGHITVDGSRVDVASYRVQPDSIVEIRERSRQMPSINKSLGVSEKKGIPAWLNLDREKYKGTVSRRPEREDVQVPISENLIVEFYSRV